MTAARKPTLEGRVALVTGAGRGLGRAYVKALAAHGAKVVVNNRSPESAATAVAAKSINVRSEIPARMSSPWSGVCCSSRRR